MKTAKWFEVVMLVASLGMGWGFSANAEDAAKELAHDTAKHAKKAVNKAKDATCPLVDGKVQCATKKLGHKLENVKEEAKDDMK